MQGKKKEMPIAALEQKGMLQILIALLEYSTSQPANMTILKNKTGLHNQTIEDKVELLKNMSFIDDRREKGVPGEHKVWLTERGRQLGEILAQGDALLRRLKL